MFNVLVEWKCQLVSLARLQSLKLFLDLRVSFRANDIAFKFHGEGQIMAGIIKAEPWRRSYKTSGVIISYDLPLFGFRMQHLNIFSLEKRMESVSQLFFFLIHFCQVTYTLSHVTFT